MSLPQALSFAVVAAMMILFAWDRWRYDVVALAALMASVACGIVPAAHAFDGFSNELLPLIASVLVMSAALSKSGVIATVVRPLVRRMRSTGAQVLALVTAIGFLSAVIKNVGALAAFLPLAAQISEKSRRSPSLLLMPMSFGALLGGTMTLIGTSPNLIASNIRQQLYGKPFAMLDFLPVGLGLTIAGVAYLSVGWRLIPQGRKGHALPEKIFRIEDYLAEAHVPADSPFVGRSVFELETMADNEANVAAIIRGDRRFVPSGRWQINQGDVLVLQSDPQALERVIAEARLELVEAREQPRDRRPAEEMATVEAVVDAGSLVVGLSPAELRLRSRYGVNLLALRQRGRAAATRLRQMRFRVGDVLALQGRESDITDTLAVLGLLPLAERRLALGRPRNAVAVLLLLLGAAVILSSLDVLSPAIAFLGAATIVALARIMTLRELYAAIEWPILVMLGALIPVGEAVRNTGASALIADAVSHAAHHLPAAGVLASVLLVTMLVTPFLHHAAAVIVMGPLAASLAAKLGLHGDPFLMAVAVGASCDFLTPIGHQCNTLVMGPGGYRFKDYWHLGLPLSVLVVVLGTLLISIVWPLS